MREELDDILAAIGATFLTTAEWAKAAAVLDGRYSDEANYQALYAVLCGRSTCEGELESLHDYFKQRGLTPQALENKKGKSNIFIGAPLG